ncbi:MULTISPECIES: tRNA dihydrouridine(20/20a) synthase DusA [Gammaproteobacteria]|uniref:tRNA dihydrouridine(20/20a) synthase DusA n=1 Tax=Gammaproteobacteria TaxID=1236 RepID=UPI000DD0828F|nr:MULTISPECIES: tRNA dihydrouridine(20/20a) synthase DusA [Gammaproteobacteria]RTE87660.1 tRNA dihydrouridine(20/20a) synthase DusA [Aliidiomarina sp. B3213]TCZ92556.1 tRNA dihydrouridine(20/20a) synthase DusA [Lysobacter sp. N42]
MFSVAPMLDWTDRHCRYFHRLMSNEVLLYTEMVTTGAIIYGKYDLLEYHQSEHPVALQLGGSDPKDLARCTKIAVERGYDEINLNVGCPSDRVQNGSFGACLMEKPQLVADCIKAMQDAAGNVPVTVKTRLGIDHKDSYEFLQEFIEAVSAVGCERFILHARKAWLNGLSPKENREIPELDYERVYRVKNEYPNLTIDINGGVNSIAEAKAHLEFVDGVMIGRAAYQTPWIVSQVDECLGHTSPVSEREEVVEKMIPYIEQHIKGGGKFWHVARHMLGLFHGQPGAKQWRRLLSEQGPRADSCEPLLKGSALLEEHKKRAELTPL